MKTTKFTTQRGIALATLGVMSVSTLGVAGVANAGSKGRLNTTIGLGAVTAYGLLKKNKTVAIGGALGTAYAYSKYKKAKKAEDIREARRIEWYKQRYGRNWRNFYRRAA